MKKFLVILVMALAPNMSLVPGTAQHASAADPIASDADEKSKGDTTVKGSYSVEDINNNVKITVDFSVKKTGVAGTGKGAMGFEILGDDWEPVFKITKGFTVGADASGANKKEFRKSLTATGPKAQRIRDEGIYAAFQIELEKDTSGIPSSAKEWKEAISDWKDLAGDLNDLKSGASLVRDGWRIFKIK